MAKRKSTKGQTTIYKTHTYKTIDRVRRNALTPGGELWYSGRVSSSCSTSDSTKTGKIKKNTIRKTKKKSNTDPIEKPG